MKRIFRLCHQTGNLIDTLGLEPRMGKDVVPGREQERDPMREVGVERLCGVGLKRFLLLKFPHQSLPYWNLPEILQKAGWEKRGHQEQGTDLA